MRVTVSSWLCLVLFWSCFGVFSLSPFDIIFTLISPYFLLLFESSRILPLGHCSGRRVFPTFKPWTSPPSPRAPRPWPARRSACSPPPGARPSGDSSKKLSVTKATLYCTYSILEWRWVILIFLHVPLEKLDWAHFVEKFYEWRDTLREHNRGKEHILRKSLINVLLSVLRRIIQVCSDEFFVFLRLNFPFYQSL